MWRAVVLVVAWLALERVAAADAAEAFEHAKASYAAGDFASAAATFRAAFEADPQADYLFGWAQAVRRGGDCPGAMALYRHLLAMQLTDEQAAATRQAMSRCPDTPPPRLSHWYDDRAGDAFAIAGAVCVAGGAWSTIRSISDEHAARAATTYGEHVRLGDLARDYRIAGVGLLAVGALAGAYGAYRIATHDGAATVTAFVHPTGAGLALETAW